MRHPEFEVHILNSTGLRKARELQEIFDEALTKVDPMIPSVSRETSLVHTHLELASFYAKKAMAKVEENQLSEEGGKL